MLKAPLWIEWLAHKLNRFTDIDYEDAQAILRHIPNTNRQSVWRMLQSLQPEQPRISRRQFEKRFKIVWKKVYGEK